MNKYKRVRQDMLILAIISIVIFAVIEVFFGRYFSFVGNLLIYVAIANVVVFLGVMILEVNNPVYSRFVMGSKITWGVILCLCILVMQRFSAAEDIQKRKEEQRKKAVEESIYHRKLNNKESYHKDGSGCGKTSSNKSHYCRYSNYSYSYSYDFDPDDYDSECKSEENNVWE